MMLAGLTRIPSDLLEAARLMVRGHGNALPASLAAAGADDDGASGDRHAFVVQRLRVIWLLTSGGPAGATRTLPVADLRDRLPRLPDQRGRDDRRAGDGALMAFAVLATRKLALSGDER